MSDPRANIHAFYDAQYNEIDKLFDHGEVDSPELVRLLDAALADAFLPRWYRAEYELMRALSAGEYAKEYIQRAKDVIEDMRQVLIAEDRDQRYIEERLAPLNGMVKAVEDDLVDIDAPDAEDEGGEDDEAEQIAQGHTAERPT